MTVPPTEAAATSVSAARAPRGRPRFTIVTAVYNVEAYLPAFIDSIERQRIGPDELEVIAIDDGSTDGSLDVLLRWARRSRFRVLASTQPNAGQGAARNAGLRLATGEWVTFTDPDDLLDDQFFRVAARFARDHPDVDVLAGNPVMLLEDLGRLADRHPRRRQYRPGNRVVDLDLDPNVFLGVSSGGLFRLDPIRDAGIEFDTRIRPNFEDGHFAARCILEQPRALLGVLRDARYIYRKRAAGTSTLQRSGSHPGRYGAVLEHGYLDLMERARARVGAVPAWVQQLIIYELSWYLSADEQIATDVRLPEELAPRFHDLLGQVVRNLDPEVVLSHGVRRMRLVWQDILAHGLRPEPWHSPAVVRDKRDRTMGLLRLAYRYVGPPPSERFIVGGTEVAPAFGKHRAHRYYGRTLAHERIVWVPEAAQLEIELDGEPVPVAAKWIRHRIRRRRRRLRDRLWLYRRLSPRLLMGAVLGRLRKRGSRVVNRLLRRLARVPPYGSRFRDAWVVMDRVNNADDNGERLYEYLRAARPDINAWFVLLPGTPDWDRLRRKGTRLVAWGSLRWKLLMLNATWLISSHADRAIVDPPSVLAIRRRRRWKFAFLQHGVIKDDLSLWLNNRDIDMFVVSTEAELESVAGDGTGYIVTQKETRNTGLPRFDRLLEQGSAVRPDDRDLVIVAPTWRTWLTLPIDRRTNTRAVDERFLHSDYWTSWSAILTSPRIAEAARRHGRTLAFMPHPNFQPILRQLDLPAHVTPLSFAGNDVQALYARCALLVTDYSSVAFNIAYLDRPIVYFQFDAAEVEQGGHMGRKGYFEYDRDGYGPVVTDVAAAEAAIVEAIERGPSPDAAYQARIDAAFPVRDGRSCERVVAVIEELSRPYPGLPSSALDAPAAEDDPAA